MKYRVIFPAIFILLFAMAATAFAEGGILLPTNRSNVPSDALELAEMEVRVDIDNGMAKVAVLQIYRSNFKRVLEGTYDFVVPERAEISGFAIWEDGVRIPGVILEKKKARDTYDELHAKAVDPGLLESDEDNPNLFTCSVFPIPAFGTKRIELFYTESLPVEDQSQYFHFPLKPPSAFSQKVGTFKFNLSYKSLTPIGPPEFQNEDYEPVVQNLTANSFDVKLNLEEGEFTENFSMTVPVPVDKTDMTVLSYRNTERVWVDFSPDGLIQNKENAGFYGARVLFGTGDKPKDPEPKQVVVVLDTSLSMQWGKLEQAYALAQSVFNNLRPGDFLGMVTFDASVRSMDQKVIPWSAAVQAKAQEFLDNGEIAGGTDFTQLFRAVEKQFNSQGKKLVVLITDGSPTMEELKINKLISEFKRTRLARRDVRLFVVGVGGDASRTFLKELSLAGGGPLIQLIPEEDTSRKTELLLNWLDARFIEEIKLRFSGMLVKDQYPQAAGVAFEGGSVDFVGRFPKAGAGEAICEYTVEGDRRRVATKVNFQEKETDHEGLRRRWAKERVLYLLDLIAKQGEKDEWVKEIITLSKQYNFVTPYTSFLAAPRSLLRPRVIRPGDPILRVRTDPSVRSVIASFPFGLTKKMRYLPDEDIWQLRFLVPPGYPDGSYSCKLHLSDAQGNHYIEEKRFTIDGRPPNIKPQMNERIAAGNVAEFVAFADSDTRRLSVSLPFAGTCKLVWDPERKANVGRLKIPDSMPGGPHRLAWFAEDFAHNVTRLETEVEVIGHE